MRLCLSSPSSLISLLEYLCSQLIAGILFDTVNLACCSINERKPCTGSRKDGPTAWHFALTVLPECIPNCVANECQKRIESLPSVQDAARYEQISSRRARSLSTRRLALFAYLARNTLSPRKSAKQHEAIRNIRKHGANECCLDVLIFLMFDD